MFDRFMVWKSTILATMCCVFWIAASDATAVVMVDTSTHTFDLDGPLGTFDINFDEAEGSVTTDLTFGLEFHEDVDLRIHDPAGNARTDVVSEGSDVLRLGVGDEVGPSSGFDDPLGAKILWSETFPTNWTDDPTPAFIGARFMDEDGAFHFAWIHFGVNPEGTVATIFGRAYETVPGKAITVPEPGTVLALVGSMVCCVVARRR